MVRKKRNKSAKRVGVAFFIVVLIAGISLGYYGFQYLENKKSGQMSSGEIIFEQRLSPGEHEAVIKVPAVDNEGNGVSTDLVISLEEGTGKTLVDINTLLFWVDTQNSIRMAKIVAQEYTGVNLDDYDITYKINADASLIGGESAGAALTIATIAAIQDERLREDVMITGTINHDGSLGPIGEVLKKATAAKEAGATIFLVPLLQGSEITYEENKYCETFGMMEWCNIERIPKKIDIDYESGIEIVEVGSITDAYPYFISR